MTGLIQRHSGIYRILLSFFAVGAPAFGQSVVVITNPPGNGVISGAYTMSGYALFDATAVTSVQVTAYGSNLSAYANYADPTTGVCPIYPTFVGCNAGTSNVGWDLTVDTTTLPPGPEELVVTAAPRSVAAAVSVTVDQPPVIQLASTPSAGGGSGSFTFTTSLSTTPSLQSISGWISQSFGSTPACAFSFWPGSNTIGLLNDDGSSWQWVDWGSDVSNSECFIHGDSSYGYWTGVLTLDITFLGGLQGPQYIWFDATDPWLDSNWQGGIPWNTQPPTPVINSFTPSSGASGTPVTVSGSLFGASQGSGAVTFGGVEATNVTSWGPSSITASVPVGAMTGPIAVTANGLTGASRGNFTVPVAPPVESIDPLPAVLSGTVTMSGWALDSAALMNPNSVQISIGGVVAGSATYGLTRSDACSGQYQNWPGCPNVGWLDYWIDTTQAPQGPSELVTVSAATQSLSPLTGTAQSTAVVDQPPAITYTTPGGGPYYNPYAS
jgi:hypothetical protein